MTQSARTLAIVAAVMAACFSFSAPAQAASCPSSAGISYAECDDQGEAYAAAWAAASAQAGISNAGGGSTWVPMVEPEDNAYVGFVRPSYASTGRYASSKRGYKNSCLSRTEQTGWANSSQMVCERGCAYKLYGDGAGGHYYSTFNDSTNSSYGTCKSSDETPPPKPKPDPGPGTDPGTDPGGTDPGGGGTDPGGGGGTNPGGGGGTDPGGGGGTGPGPDPKPCPAGGKDADGKPCPGEGGGTDPGGGPNPGEGSGSGSGSGTCAKPPVCSGDAIQCAQLFQQWRAGCQAEGLGGKVTGDPTNCKAAYQCEGNAVACGQLAVMRKQMCGAGEGDGNGTLTGDGTCAQSFVCTGGDPVACAELKQVHMLRCAVEKLTKEGNGEDDYGETLNASDFVGISEGEGIEGLDAGGWLGGGSCPALNNTILSQMGVKGLDMLCQGAAVLAAYVLFLGWLHAAFILGRSLTGGG